MSITKGFLAMMVLAAACLVAEAAKPTRRVEGTFRAVYDCTNAAGGLDATAYGKAVYYVGDHGKVDYKIYTDSVSGTFRGEAIDKEILAIKALNAFWPAALNAADADSVLSDTETEVVLSYDIASRINSDDEKLMRMTGSSSKIREWTNTCTCTAAAGTHVPDTIKQTLDMTATGANFRRLFGADSTICRMNVIVNIHDSKLLTPEEAKAVRKAERKRFAGGNK